MNDLAKSLSQFSNSGDLLSLTQKSDAMPEGLALTLNSCEVSLLDPGVLSVQPNSPSDIDLVISAGIHGNETAPIELVNLMIMKIFSGQIIPSARVLFIFGNHRNYSGTEAARAEKLENHLTDFYQSNHRRHYDLHTAIRDSSFEKFAIYPFREDKKWSQTQLAFLQSCGIDAILLSHAPSTTFSYHSSNRHNANAFTLELGKAHPLGQNDLSKFGHLVQNFEHLIQDPFAKKTLTEATATGYVQSRALQQQTRPTDKTKLHLFRVKEEILKGSEEFKFHFSLEEKNFTQYPKGTLIYTDKNTQYVTKTDGERIVFPNPSVKIGQRAGLIVSPASL